MALLMSLVMCLSALSFPALGEEKKYTPGEQVAGFTVKELSRLDLVNADATLLSHDKTGALVMLLENEDTNRTFDISFRTPVSNDMGIPHVFEHATLGGSMKYPSQSLFFNLMNQTYNTYMNAMTTDVITTYPVASLSEEQLLKYADYYTDSVFSPLVMEEKNIFLEEAWRYTLENKDAPLTISGTVYTEMQGAYNIQTDAMFNLRKTLFPGSQVGNSYGGHPGHIADMSWEDLKDYHDAYYHPSNSLTILYGKYQDAEAFLKQLDGYFSAFEKKEFAFADAAYQPLTAPAEEHFDFAVEAGSDTANGAVVYFGYVLKGISREDELALDLMSTLLNNPSSPFQQAMKEKLPSATASTSLLTSSPEPAFLFQASGLNAQDAPIFRDVTVEALQELGENGFDLAAVEAVAAQNRLDLLLTSESASIGTNLAPNIAYLWGATGDTQAFSQYVDSTVNYLPYAQQGVYQRVIAEYLTDNPRTALVVTSPKPGLKEQQSQALADSLQQRKAAMSEEEITSLVEATALYNQEKPDDSAQYVAQLQAVGVSTLPEERRIYAIQDETGEDKVRRLHAQADVSGVGQVLLLLDAAAIPQEDLHWYKLYTDLLGKLDTKAHDNAALSALLTRYLYQRDIRPTVYTGENRDQCDPFLRVSWIAMDEDLPAAYDLVYELLFDTKLDDAAKTAAVLSQVKASLKQMMTDGAYQVQIYRAFASGSPAFAYFNYLNFLDYYAFLENAEALFASDPDAALRKLQAVQAFLRSYTGAVSAFAGSDDSAKAHRQTADAFLAKLEKTNREKAVYDLPAIAPREAIVVDSAVQYNILYAPYKAMGRENSSGDMDALSRLVSDRVLLPQLREKYGAYGAEHAATEDGILLLSFRDPNVKETFDVYAALPEMIENMQLDQETLDGFILSAYSAYALSQGELTGALSALLNTLDGRPQEIFLTWMKELKELTPDKVKSYADMYRALNEKGYRSTAGGAAIIEQNKDLFDAIYNPFLVKDTSGDELSDVKEGDWYYEAVRYVFEKKAMAPASEGAFGVENPATLGEIISTVFALAGVPASAEQGVQMFQQMGLLAPEAAAQDEMTREMMASVLGSFLGTAAGLDMTVNLASLEEVPDADQITPGMEDLLRYALGNDLLKLTEDGRLAPQEPATRAQLAYAIWKIDQME